MIVVTAVSWLNIHTRSHVRSLGFSFNPFTATYSLRNGFYLLKYVRDIDYLECFHHGVNISTSCFYTGYESSSDTFKV